jgi:sugar/nucleoside kinase (ribokinase family)
MAPPRGRKSVSSAVELSAGGPAANAAVTCAALLGSATLVTAIGDGPLTTVVREDLAAHHVRVIDLADTSTHSPTATARARGMPGGSFRSRASSWSRTAYGRSWLLALRTRLLR